MKTWQQISDEFNKKFTREVAGFNFVMGINDEGQDAYHDPEEVLSFLHSTLDEYMRELIGEEEAESEHEYHTFDESWCYDCNEIVAEKDMPNGSGARNDLRKELLKKHEENLKI